MQSTRTNGSAEAVAARQALASHRGKVEVVVCSDKYISPGDGVGSGSSREVGQAVAAAEATGSQASVEQESRAVPKRLRKRARISCEAGGIQKSCLDITGSRE